MSPTLASVLADLVLVVHVAIILFNIGGLIVIPLGAWAGWGFVRIFWWRTLHVAVLAVVAIQPVLGRTCFLTLWQSGLAQSGAAAGDSMLRRWIDAVIFWPLPIWFFAVLYVAVFIYTLALWWLVPPRRSRG